jgi:hypothetical protein
VILMPYTQPVLYEIRVQGHVAERYSDWFGLSLEHGFDHTQPITTLRGPLPDQSAPHPTRLVSSNVHPLSTRMLTRGRLEAWRETHRPSPPSIAVQPTVSLDGDVPSNQPIRCTHQKLLKGKNR